MKNTFLALGTAVLFLLGTSITGCNGTGEQSSGSEMQEQQEHEHNENHEHSDEHKHEHMEGEHTVMYYCPMKCEGDKTYSKPGKCPVCEMDLEKVEENGADHTDHNHDEHHGHDH